MVSTITLEEIFLTFPHIEGVKVDIEGAEVPVLQEITWVPVGLIWIVLEFSFDYFREMRRFHALMHRLGLWFDVETDVRSEISETCKAYPKRPWNGFIYCKRKRGCMVE